MGSLEQNKVFSSMSRCFFRIVSKRINTARTTYAQPQTKVGRYQWSWVSTFSSILIKKENVIQLLKMRLNSFTIILYNSNDLTEVKTNPVKTMGTTQTCSHTKVTSFCTVTCLLKNSHSSCTNIVTWRTNICPSR